MSDKLKAAKATLKERKAELKDAKVGFKEANASFLEDVSDADAGKAAKSAYAELQKAEKAVAKAEGKVDALTSPE